MPPTYCSREASCKNKGALHRILDEVNEDIAFLAIARTNDTVTPLHERYLAAFNEDMAPAHADLSKPVKGPDTPSRKEIRKYIKRQAGAGIPESSADAAIAKAYSGYIHAASQNVMEMYGGLPPKFHLNGQRGTPMQLSHALDSWNYLYRGFGSFVIAAKAFGDGPCLEVLDRHLVKLNALMGIRH